MSNTSSTFDYKPSLLDASKYGKYLHYFTDYLKHGDFKSLGTALNYMFAHKLPKQDYEAKSGMGKFLIRKNSLDFQFINYAYEKSVKDYLVKNMDSFDVFIDVGACIGEYDVWLAGFGKRCVAIEPVNFMSTQRNVELNNVADKVKIFRCGVSDQKGRAYFEIPGGTSGNMGAACINRDSGKEPNVDIERIDDLMAQVNLSPNDRVLMKLDVEGMEPEAIRGAAGFIRSRKDLRVIYEHFIEDNYRNDKALSAIADFDFHNIDEVNRLAIKKA